MTTDTTTEPAETTDTPRPTVHEAIAAVRREVGPVGKNQRNTQQNFNFRGVDDVVNATSAALAKHGVLVVPAGVRRTRSEVQVGQKRTPMGHVDIDVTYRWYGPGGDSFDTVVPGEAMDSGDKAVSKAMSVAYRIVLLQVLNLPTETTDPDAESYERSEPAPPAKTDQTWYGNIQHRIREATTPEAIRGLAPEVNQRLAAGTCTQADADRIWEFGTKRIDEMQGSAA